MHYFLDGYNMMFRIARATEDFRRQREQIISDLSTKIQILELDVTVVFDAKYQPGGATRSHTPSIEILYTAEGETADEFILNELKGEKRPSEHTVVTSDKKLAYLAKLCHSKTESVEDFIGWLNRRYRNKLRRQDIKRTPIKPLKSMAKSLPKPGTTPEESFDFYLHEFEKRLHKEDPISIKVEKEIVSDMQRWLRAFERNL